jgi:predicted small lipoprotein YifL
MSGSRAAALLLLAATLILAGCGKKGPPSPYGPPDQVTFPRAYPAY